MITKLQQKKIIIPDERNVKSENTSAIKIK